MALLSEILKVGSWVSMKVDKMVGQLDPDLVVTMVVETVV